MQELFFPGALSGALHSECFSFTEHKFSQGINHALLFFSSRSWVSAGEGSAAASLPFACKALPVMSRLRSHLDRLDWLAAHTRGVWLRAELFLSLIHWRCS